MAAGTQLPTGNVTFLFTDIQGSTELLRRLGQGRFTTLGDQHDAIVRTAFESLGGVEVGTEGDAFFVVFTDATNAVMAAARAQEALAAHSWPEDAQVKVRMGLHTGSGIRGG